MDNYFWDMPGPSLNMPWWSVIVKVYWIIPVSQLLNILTSVWVLCTQNADRNMLFNIFNGKERKKPNSAKMGFLSLHQNAGWMFYSLIKQVKFDHNLHILCLFAHFSAICQAQMLNFKGIFEINYQSIITQIVKKI